MSQENQEPLPEDATHVDVDETTLLGKRDVALNRLSIQFKAVAQNEQWRQLFQDLKFRISRSPDEELAVFAALPETPKALRPYLTGRVSIKSKRPGVARWRFEWDRSPNDNPPEDIQALSAAVGGFPTLLEKLSARWPVTEPVEAEVSAAYVLHTKAWRFRFPSMRAKRIRSDQQAFKLSPTHWDIEPPSGPVSTVSWRHMPVQEVIEITGKGSYMFRCTSRFLNELDGAVWAGLRTFLERR
jgi:hypothetical protein